MLLQGTGGLAAIVPTASFIKVFPEMRTAFNWRMMQRALRSRFTFPVKKIRKALCRRRRHVSTPGSALISERTLTGVELDDHVHLGLEVHVLTGGQSLDLAGQVLGVEG